MHEMGLGYLDMYDKMDSLSKARGWSRSEMLRRVGLNSSALRDWRLGKASPDKYLPRIAEVLGTTEMYLRGETDDPSPKQNEAPPISAMEQALRRLGAISPDGTVDEELIDIAAEFLKVSEKIRRKLEEE